MTSVTPNRRVVLAAGIAVVVAVALAFATAAFGTGTADSTEIVKLKRQVAALQLEVKSHAVMRSKIDVLSVSTRIAFVDAAGIHAMETTKWPNLTSRDVTALQNVLAVSAKIGWPSALKEEARELVTTCRAFLAAWNAGNKEEALKQLQATHAAYHALTAAGYRWLS